jgi:hypothetical protein
MSVVTRCRRQKDGQEGQSLIEFTLSLPLLLLLIFGIVNEGWLLYRTVTLQFAVREGCRYAITNQTLKLKDSGGNNYGVIESVKYIVQQRAIGLLGTATSDPRYGLIHVRFYNPATGLTTEDTSATRNQGGNIVEVSVEGYNAQNLVPFMPTFFVISPDARSSDRMEGSPIGTLPAAGANGP